MWRFRGAKRRQLGGQQLGVTTPLEQRVLLSAGQTSALKVDKADSPRPAANMVVDVSGRWNVGDVYLDLTQNGFKLKGYFTILGNDAQFRIRGKEEFIGPQPHLVFTGKGHYQGDQKAKISISSLYDHPLSSELLDTNVKITFLKSGTELNQFHRLYRV